MLLAVRRCYLRPFILVGLVASVFGHGHSSAQVRWYGVLHNLAFAALDEREVRILASDYASDVAHALDVHPVDVMDLEGHLGSVSLEAPTGYEGVGPASSATVIVCQIADAANLSAADVTSRLQEEAFRTSLASSTLSALDNSSDAVVGEIMLDHLPGSLGAVVRLGDAFGKRAPRTWARMWLSHWLPHLLGIGCLVVVCGLFVGVVVANNWKRWRREEVDDA